MTDTRGQRDAGSGASTQPPPWDRGEFKFWVGALSAFVVLALILSVVAIAVARPRDTVAASGSGKSGQAVAAFPGQKINFATDPAADFRARDPKAPVVETGTVHRITLEATEKDLEIAPGVLQRMWTFGDTVPGPVLRGKVGDTFEITLVNKGSIQHSIDFHASKVAWNVEMRSIDPGQSLVYTFVAQKSGIFMYHCGTPPVLHHIGNGMYGALIIDPPDLQPVDHEFVMVQSELYTAPEGEVAQLEKMLAEQWDGVVFNGYVNQYKFDMIRVEPHERVRVWVLDAGPSENSSFHVIGTIFDTVYKEGTYLLRPGPQQGGSQALDLQPAQGGFVEFTFDVPGLYPFVTHKFASASKGALGLFQAGQVAMPEGGVSH
ncbi:MAG: multicopper oxidase domain-containing protein [Acidimicrobiia bacterium]